MNIEQAKKLKVGEFVFTTEQDGIANMTNGSHYKIEKIYLPLITLTGNDGRFIDVSASLLTPDIKTKWIPFDADRTGEAMGYRMTRGSKVVTEVVMIADCLAWLTDNGEFDCARIALGLIEMQVEDKIKYPCLCKSKADEGLVTLIRDDRFIKYWTPLTDDELLEIGLVRAKS